MTTLFIRDIAGILGLSIAVILLFQRLRVPVVIGFLITGVIAGPHGLGLVGAVQEVEVLAEVGVILLLFTIGIEFSLKDLLALRKSVLLGGTLQVLLTILLTVSLLQLVRIPLGNAIFYGMLVSLSSTAIVLRLLQDRAEINTPHGRTSLAILIFQDVAVVPMILITPLLAGVQENQGTALAVLLVKAVGVVAFAVAAAKWIVPWILHQVARTRSRELFLLSVIAICFFVAWLTSSIGLSLALGAFLAGLIISESEYSTYAVGNILPLRDLFTSFFFISIGMLLDGSFLIAHPVLLVLLAATVVAVKVVVAGFTAFVLGHAFHTTVFVALGLAQIGEFSFILSRSGIRAELFLGDHYQAFLAASILTMATAPFFLTAAYPLADFLSRLPGFRNIQPGIYPVPQEVPETLFGHLIIVGYGVNGRNVAIAARYAHIPYIIIETNPETVRSEKAKGEPIFFGDAAQEAVLIHAGVQRARALVVAIPDAAATEQITNSARRLNSALHIIIRTRQLKEVKRLFQLGADEVIPEEFETSVAIFNRVLRVYQIPEDQIQTLTADIRKEGYQIFQKT
jgi:CPA2 family monovalent cation:H+ antiporter-2